MIASTKVTEQAESRWAKIVERFRAACVLYKEGDEGESRRIIKEELPGLIRSWTKLLPHNIRFTCYCSPHPSQPYLEGERHKYV